MNNKRIETADEAKRLAESCQKDIDEMKKNGTLENNVSISFDGTRIHIDAEDPAVHVYYTVPFYYEPFDIDYQQAIVF